MRNLRGLVWLSVPLIISLVAGWIGYYSSGEILRRYQEGLLLRDAQTIAAALDSEKLNSLAGNETDLDNLDFQRLRRQLTSIGGTFPDVRYVYLMGEAENGSIFFYVDSEPEKFTNAGQGEPLATPGEEYVDEDPEFAKIFQLTNPRIWPATEDKWGEFISISFPLTDKVLTKKMVLGIDVDAKIWRQNINRGQILPTVFGIIAVWLFYFIYRNYSSNRLLREQENRFRVVVDVAKDGIVMINSKDEIVLWNKAAGEMFGFSENEAIGRKFNQLISIEPVTKFGSSVELSAKQKEGVNITIELTLAQTKINRLLYTVGVVRDITARKKAESELAERADELERINRLMINRELEMVKLKQALAGINEKS
jgi:PAS domain S-box-containing protein